jgi:thiosulfate reductase/polysulfide reductase chain A
MKTGFAWVACAASSYGAVHKNPTNMNNETISVSRTSLKPLLAIPTTCEQCPAGCGILAYIDGSRIVQILGNPNHPNNKGKICAKGIAGINLVNDPERVLYPMKRVGPRGSDHWSKITWDEAFFRLTSRIKNMRTEGREREFVVDKGRSDLLLDRFIDASGSMHVIDRVALKNLNRDSAFTSMVGHPSLVEDVGKSRFILNFGANPYANHDQFIGIARRLIHARVEKGASLATFDVRMSETAAKSDVWYPVRSGTDGLIALAMAHVIVERGLADQEFMDHKTNASLSSIKQHLSRFTPQVAEKESGVRANDIEQLAVRYATEKPSLAMIGGGAIDHQNGSQNVRCIALLNWLVGNLEKEGGLSFPRFPGKSQSAREYWHLAPLTSKKTIQGIRELHDSNAPIDTYFAYLSNPAYVDPDCTETSRLLIDEKIVPFLVVMDTHLTETARLADMVLPAATYLEGWGVSCAPPLDGVPILNLKQPVAQMLSAAQVLRSPAFDGGKLLDPVFRPKGEAKQIGDFCLELARRVGGKVSEELVFKDTHAYISEIIASFPGIKTQDDIQAFKTAGLWIDESLKNTDLGTQNKKDILGTRNKVYIYSDALKQKGQSPFPEYQPLVAHKKKKEGQFILTMFKSNLMSNGTANSKWTREILHENRLWINKKAAAKLGIKNGDRVRVTSLVGSLNTRVLTTERIHPESVAMAEGFGHNAIGHVAKARPFKSADRDTNLIWWKKKGNGVNPYRIIERRIDPIGGGQGLKDTVVRVEKIE